MRSSLEEFKQELMTRLHARKRSMKTSAGSNDFIYVKDINEIINEIVEDNRTITISDYKVGNF